MEGITLVESNTRTELSLDDEQARDGMFVSATLTSGDGGGSWGMFLTREQAFAMWAWLYGVLYHEPKWSDPDFAQRIRGTIGGLT